MKDIDQILKNIYRNKFLIIGRAGIDIYPDPPGTKTKNAKVFVSHLGGSSANIGVALKKLGGNCHLLTCISNDALGQFVINQLKYYGVKTSLIKKVKGSARLSLAVVETTVKDHQSIIYRNNAADLQMNKKDILNLNFSKFASLIITGTSLASEPSRSATFLAMNLAKKNKMNILLDIDYRPYTWKSLNEASKIYLKATKLCDVVIGNDEEFAVLAKNYKKGLSLAKKLSENDSPIVIYKMGEKGSITFTNNQSIKTGIFKVNALKPTGAGDAFMGTLIASLLKKMKIKDAVLYASAAAAIVVTKVGCAPAMPNFKEINSFIKKTKLKKFNKEI